VNVSSDPPPAGPAIRDENKTIERILHGCLTWLERNRSFFDPFRDGQLVGRSVIPLSELAILTLSLLRTRPTSFDQPSTARFAPQLAHFLDVLEAAHRRPAFQERPFREPPSLVSHLIVRVALEHGGRLPANGGDRAPFARLLTYGNLTAPSLPPHRTMELRHALDLAGVPSDLPPYRQLYERTAAARPLNPVFMSKAEAYVLTHVLFYAADLGFRAPLGIDPAERERLAILVDRLLGMSIVERNWDLVAEFILSANCLRSSSRFTAVAWDCLESAQRAGGAVPGTRATLPEGHGPDGPPEPHGPHGPWQGSPGQDHHAGEVSTCYHTTLVTALAALSTIHRAATERHDRP
jgi:hypothetical protein